MEGGDDALSLITLLLHFFAPDTQENNALARRNMARLTSTIWCDALHTGWSFYRSSRHPFCVATRLVLAFSLGVENRLNQRAA